MDIGIQKPMNETVKGIVIDVKDYKENDALITVMTQSYGKLAFVVKGYKKITSKNAYATQLFDHSIFQFDYRENQTIQLLKTAVLTNDFTNIRQDYEKITVASVICEIASKLMDENTYALLVESFTQLNSLDQANLVLDLFLVEVLHCLGIYPNVDGCVLCGDHTSIETISLEAGGYLCAKCNREIKSENVDVDLLRKFRIINKASFAVLDKLLPLNMNEYRLTDILMMFFVTYSGIYLKSYKSLTNLNS